jgi:hypothetical protein
MTRFYQLAFTLTTVLTVALAGGPAVAADRTVPIGPHEPFGGLVNGAGAHATVHMACFGPEWPGKTGHPMGGQTVGVFVPELLRDEHFGNTGRRGHAILAYFRLQPGGRVPAAVFTRLTLQRPVLTATRPLPTSLDLPCSGQATAVFAPLPAGPDRKSATVDVTFTGQP